MDPTPFPEPGDHKPEAKRRRKTAFWRGYAGHLVAKFGYHQTLHINIRTTATGKELKAATSPQGQHGSEE
ncbi:MAG: hypothetical protein NZ954_08835 [Thermofilaceae archaeon]|nr:hypothetical protein [Thermofilaceae archaeon]